MYLSKLLNNKNKNIVLLQGPIGKYFNKLNKKLSINNKVFHFIFNAGDNFFSSSKNKVFFYKNIKKWEEEIENFILIEDIDIIILFNDNKNIHNVAIKVAKKLDKEIYVFEQGYLRPFFITCEPNGVNINSFIIPKSHMIYDKMSFNNNYKINIQKETNNIKSNFKKLYLNCFIYGFLNYLFFIFYPNTKNNQSYNINFFKEGSIFLINKIKRSLFNFIEHNIIRKKLTENYFFIPLQISNDKQIIFNSKYKNIEEFIEEVIMNFSNSNTNDILIFKEHPLSIYLNEKIIKKISKKYNIENKVFYFLNGSINEFIKNSKGVITINSTVGISALYHKKPVKVMGKAIYDIKYLTNTNKNLKTFFISPISPNEKILSNFMNYILYHTQVSDNFYK